MLLLNDTDTILLVEDDDGIAELIQQKLGEDNLSVSRVKTIRDACAWLAFNYPPLVLLDFSLPDGSGDELVRRIGKMPPFIVTTGMGDERVAVAMMKKGALDYLVKDSSFLDTLPLVVHQALHQIAIERQLVASQKALREKESMYRKVIDTVMDGFWMINSETQQILEVNDAYCIMSGYSRAELLQMSIAHLEANESASDVDDHIRRILAQNGDRFETAHRRKNGDKLHLEISVQPMPEIGMNFAFLHDITERKQREDALAFLAQCGIAPGEDFFQSLARYLAVSLHMDYVCIDRLSGDQLSAQTVAIYFDGNFEDNVSYTLQDTPCGDVAGKTICTFHQGVRHLFPKDVVLQEMLAESYVGTTLWGHDGYPIGLIAVIGRRPLDNPQLAAMMLKLVAARAAGELERKQAEEIIEKRIVALTQPLESGSYSFDDLFSLDEIQRLQDEFASATGVASLIVQPDGTPITSPSNFTYLCSEIIRKTAKGCLNCVKSDTAIGRYHPGGPIVQPCLSGGLWDAGAAITVGGKHIASWLVGQVRDQTQTEEKMREYAREIGADEGTFIKAFYDVPAMSREQFERISSVLFTLANQLSSSAYQNVQQARFITERKQAEEALRESESRFRGYFEQGIVGMAITSSEKGWLAVNQATCDLLGYTQAELKNMTWAQLTHPDDLATDLAQFNRLLTNEIDGYRLEKRFIRKNQQTIYVDLGVQCKRKSDGKLDYILALLSNITERKQAEDALRETNEYLDNLFKYANAPIIVWDPHYKITRFNHAFEIITGRSAKDVIGKPLKVLFPSAQIKASMEHIRKTRTGERWEVVEIPIQHVDGSVRIVLWNSATLFSTDGKTPIATIAQGQDITGRKQAEAQIRAALAEKEMLLRELNHRTKNNLNIVNSLIQIQAGMSENDEFRTLALSLENRIQSISMVHQMLYKSQTLADVNLAEYARELVSKLLSALSISEKKVIVAVDAAPVFVNLDIAIPCGQILNELISNALKYAFPDERCGKVVVQIAQSADAEVILRVSDDGVGFSPDKATADSLGMTIVNTLVNQLHGSLDIVSNDGVTCEIRFKAVARF